MTTFKITIRSIFPHAAEDEVCVKFDAEVDDDGVNWSLADVVGIVAGFRQDMEPDANPESVPKFPSDFFWIPVTGTNYDDEPERLELLFDAAQTTLIEWSSANCGDPTRGLPSTATVEYHD